MASLPTSEAMSEDAFGFRSTPFLDELRRRLQDDLLAALAGRIPAQRRGYVQMTQELLTIARDLTESLVATTDATEII